MSLNGLGAVPRSLRRANPAAWEQAWKRLFSSQPVSQVARQTKRGPQETTFRLPTTRPAGGAIRPGFSNSQTIFRATQRRGFRLSPWRRNKGSGTNPEESLSLTERLRKLFREYGRAAIGVYFLLSILDYPFFFMLVKAVGTERIGKLKSQYRGRF